MMIKKTIRLWIYVILLSALFIAPTLLCEIDWMRYYSSCEEAIRHYEGTKKIVEVITIKGQEGTVAVYLYQGKSVYAYNFDTRIKNNTIQYRVAKKMGLFVQGDCFIKMNTVPKSTEELIFGTGEDLAKNCSENTGINAEFIQFELDGKTYTIWYIISPTGLNELPNVQMNGIGFD